MIQMNLNTLYPPIEPYRTGTLQVSDIHTLHYEEAGNPQGKPVVFLHGGPGGASHPVYRQFLDPTFYRMILFDQRGCGKSTPIADLRQNDTWALVADIETLRQHLGIERWLVTGGSWGSTLALAYTTTHPGSVLALLINGIFLSRQAEYRWLFQEGASMIFPDAWQHFIAPIPPEERGDMLEAYYQRLISEDPDVNIPAAKAWYDWEYAVSLLIPQPDPRGQKSPQDYLAISRIETHYFVNNCFFDSDSFLLERAESIRQLPTRIVQGRYDLVCPIDSAWALAQALPEAELRIVPDGGHFPLEPTSVHELVQAGKDFQKMFEGA